MSDAAATNLSTTASRIRVAARTLANNARVTVGLDGSINIFNIATAPVDLLIDVSGYFK